MRLLRNQNGDTIVEVLVAIAVVSAVLGGAYALMNHATNNSQQAIEHSQALKIAESQLEMLRASSTTPSTTQCFTNASTIATGAANCQFDETGAHVAGNGRYTAMFTSGSPVNLYKITVKWDGITGGTDQVELSYGVYP